MHQQPFSAPAWTLSVWPPVLWQVGRSPQLRLQHLTTQVTDSHDGLFRTAGQTFWACSSDDGEAGLAWDWVELGQGVFAMADPLSIITNVRLIDLDGDMLGRYDALTHINAMVHNLPWQAEIGRVLDDLAADQHPAQRTTQRPGAWQRPAPTLQLGGADSPTRQSDLTH